MTDTDTNPFPKKLWRECLVLLITVFCLFPGAEISSNISLLAGGEGNRQATVESTGEPDLYLAPEIGVKYFMPPWEKHKPAVSLDYSGNYYWQTGKEQTYSGELSLSQSYKTVAWKEFLVGGYTEHSGADDQDLPANYYFMGGGAGAKIPWIRPLNFRWNLRYLDELSSPRWDLKNSFSGTIKLVAWKNWLTTLGLSLNWNSSHTSEFDYFGPTFTFLTIYLIDDKYYVLGLVSLSTRSYHNAPREGSPIAMGNSKKFKISKEGEVPTAGYSLFNLGLYRELSENLEWANEVLCFFNSNSEERYFNAQIATGFHAQF